MTRQYHITKSMQLLRRGHEKTAFSAAIASSSSQLFFSTTSSDQQKKKKAPRINLQETLSSSKNKPPPNAAKQPFVTHRLSPGQPNPLHQIYKKRSIPSDPIYRPPWRHNTKANIISAEDYANRPRVVFEEQFDSLHDGMIILSWLNDKQRQDIYNAYTQMMLEQEKKFDGVTSHEYVLRVIGERFNISSLRTSAIVEEIHQEEQMMKHHPELVHEKVAEYVDTKIQEHINNCYNAYGEVNPNEYIENPIESGDVKLTNTSGDVVTVEDLHDVDELTRQAILREKDEAQLEIDGYVYKEDVDDDQIPSNVNKECLDLIKAQNQAYEDMLENWGRNEDSEKECPLPLGGKIVSEDDDGNTVERKVNRRPRWKFVAQTINVREQKQLKEKGMSKKKKQAHAKMKNTLVEHDGRLRVATMKEVNDVAWKDVRDVKGFLTKGVRSAWLKRRNGERGVWGRVPDEVKAAARAKLEEKEKNEEEANEGSKGENEQVEDDMQDSGREGSEKKD